MVDKDELEEKISHLCTVIAEDNDIEGVFNCKGLECKKCPFNNSRSFMNWFNDYKEEYGV